MELFSVPQAWVGACQILTPCHPNTHGMVTAETLFHLISLGQGVVSPSRFQIIKLFKLTWKSRNIYSPESSWTTYIDLFLSYSASSIHSNQLIFQNKSYLLKQPQPQYLIPSIQSPLQDALLYLPPRCPARRFCTVRRFIKRKLFILRLNPLIHSLSKAGNPNRPSWITQDTFHHTQQHQGRGWNSS